MKGKARLSAARHIQSLLQETWLTSWELIRITIPVAIITKILELLGLVNLLGEMLEPVMAIIGLPGPLGLVWATGMLTNLYGGIAVFAALAPGLEISSAQLTVLAASMLFAHALPLELSVSRRAGAPFLPIGCLRIAAAIVYGYFLNLFCQQYGVWQEKAALLFYSSVQSGGLLEWMSQLVKNLGLIILIIFCIVVGMRLLRVLGILALLERILTPALPMLGMTQKSAPIAVVGMVMGIGYGGALIIRETAKGEVSRSEVCNAMIFMGLCHGLVEDTLLMLAIGGKLAGIFWARIAFSLVLTFLLVKVMQTELFGKVIEYIEVHVKRYVR